MKLREGDLIIGRDGTVREIVDVRSTGYGWRYPDIEGMPPAQGENYFWSENSGDPYFDWGWRLQHPRSP